MRCIMNDGHDNGYFYANNSSRQFLCRRMEQQTSLCCWCCLCSVLGMINAFCCRDYKLFYIINKTPVVVLLNCCSSMFKEHSHSIYNKCYLRNRSAPAENCWVIIHCLEVSCKEDQITSAQLEWFIFEQLTDKQWIITQQFTHWSWSISILTHNKRRKYIRSLQLLPTFRHCTEELPPILRLRCIRLHVIVTSFKR